MINPMHDPEQQSIEDVLASIRDVISEDIKSGPRSNVINLTPREQIVPEEVLVLTNEVEEESIISPAVIAESADAFAELDKLHEVPGDNLGEKTIEQLLQELLRPMLKEWLDSHLPSLIKNLVAEQLEKMSKLRQEKY